MKTKSLEVLLWGHTVGYLAEIEDEVVFEYSDEFRRTELEISPLEMPLLTTLEYKSEEVSSTFLGLPGVFADSLPDVYGNKVINNFFFKNYGMTAKEVTPLMRLAYIHKRSIGALEYIPHSGEKDAGEFVFNITDLVDAAKKTLSGKGSEIAQEIMQIGSSAGGLRAKAVIDFNPKTKEIRAGYKKGYKNFKPCIIKFDGAMDGEEAGYYGRVEYVYNQVAKDCGINVSNSYLLQSSSEDELDAYHFISERFDRNEKKEKLYHQATFCGLTLSDYKQKNSSSYEALLRTIHGLCEPGASDVEEGLKRCIFNVVMRNEDDHTKNFSFLMNKRGKWKLAPAYDLTHVIIKNGHQMSINGKNQSITREDILELGRFIGIKDKKIVKMIEDVNLASRSFMSYAKNIGLPLDFAEGIQRSFCEL